MEVSGQEKIRKKLNDIFFYLTIAQDATAAYCGYGGI
jgi:hypothetical protein